MESAPLLPSTTLPSPRLQGQRVVGMGAGGMVLAAAAAGGATTTESTCAAAGEVVFLPMILLTAVPPFVNLVTILLLFLLIVRMNAIRNSNDEVFQSAMLLTRTALRVTIPRRAVEAVQKVVGDPKTGIKTRLTEENAKKMKKTN